MGTPLSLSSVPAATPYIQYVATSNQTVFPYPFPITQDSDLVVVINGVTQPTDSGYTLSGQGNPLGGNLTFALGQTAGTVVTLFRNIAIARLTQIAQNSGFSSTAFNAEFNNIYLLLQQLLESIGFCLQLPNTNSPAPTTSLTPLSYANKYLAFDANGNPTPALLTSSGSITAAMIGGLLTPQTPAEVAALVVPTSIIFPEGWAVRYGADSTGVADSAAAINTAIKVAKNMLNGGFVFLSHGVYKVVSQLTVDQSRIWLRGDGMYATQLLFAPTGNATCLQFGKLGAETFQCKLSDLCIFSADSTFTKIALDLLDCGETQISNVAIGGSVGVGGVSYWSGASSVGLHLRGRELADIGPMQISADIPIQISQNPNNSISIDHHHFHDLTLTANANPCVLIDTGVNLSDVTFDGYQAWVKGTYGLYWSDTTSSQVSFRLHLENVRMEQGTSTSAYMCYVSHNTGLQGLVVEKFEGGLDRNGFYLRKVANTSLRDGYYISATLIALNADSTNTGLVIDNVFWQAGCTVTLTGQTLIIGAPFNPNGAPLPPWAYYDNGSNANKTLLVAPAMSQPSLTIASGANAPIGATGTVAVVTIASNEGIVGIASLQNHATNILNDPSSVFSTTKGTGSKYNVYWDAGTSTYRIENQRASSFNLRINVLGSYEGF